jgi:hypothetical protein
MKIFLPDCIALYMSSWLMHQRSITVSNVRRALGLSLLIPALTLLSNQKRQFCLHNRGCGGPSANEPRVIKRPALSHDVSELNLLIGLDGRDLRS